MLVTVYGYEQNQSRGVGGAAHTIVWVVRTEKCNSNLALTQFCGRHKKIQRETNRNKISQPNLRITILILPWPFKATMRNIIALKS